MSKVSLKHLVVVSCISLLVNIFVVNVQSGFANFVDATSTTGGISIAVGEWIPTTPAALGWSLDGDAVSDVNCVDAAQQYVGTQALNHVWSNVDPTDQAVSIGYQQEVVAPDGTVTTSVLTEASSAVVDLPSDGTYQTRVRAFSDVNENGIYDDGEFTSDWSSSCQISKDATAPSFAGQIGWATNLPSDGYQGDGVGLDSYYTCGDTITEKDLILQAVWAEASDAGSGFATFQRQVVYNGSLVWEGDHTENYTGTFTTGGDGANGGDGEYFVRVRAIDQLGNASVSDQAWSDTTNYADWCQLTIDTTAPAVALSVNSTQLVQDQVSDGAFDANLDGWQTQGNVALVDGSENGVDPVSGTKMIRMTRDESSTLSIMSMSLTELTGLIDLSDFGFDYNYVLEQQDDSGLLVFVGNELVHQTWASEIDPANSDWKRVSLDLSSYSDDTLSIVFYGGDVANQSLVYLDNIATTETVASSDGTFSLDAVDNVDIATIYFRYWINGQEIVEQAPTVGEFTLTQQPDNGLVEYWAVDTAGNTSTIKQLSVTVAVEDSPTDSPDQPSVDSQSDVSPAEPQLSLEYDASSSNLVINLLNGADFGAYTYELIYSHMVDGQEVTDGAQGEGEITDPVSQELARVLLGTCSGSGDEQSCVTHQPVKSTVTLSITNTQTGESIELTQEVNHD